MISLDRLPGNSGQTLQSIKCHSVTKTEYQKKGSSEEYLDIFNELVFAFDLPQDLFLWHRVTVDHSFANMTLNLTNSTILTQPLQTLHRNEIDCIDRIEIDCIDRIDRMERQKN